ncbi:complement C1q-like protein [Pimephales promelas]|nr:complement C1q-like protein [Pimephales promelas]
MTGSEIISHAFSYLTRTPRPLTSDHINMSAGGITRVVVAFGFKNFLQQDGKRTALCKTCNVKIDSQMTTSNFVRHLKSHILPSTFTAPHAGLYSFSFTAYSKAAAAGERLYQKLQLMKNGQLIASSWEDNRDDSEDSSTQTVLLQLRHGCQVYVELLSGRQLCGDTQGYNTFSGYLIYPFSE